MSELLIHIGGAKTGSTALQNSLHAAQSALQAQGIYAAGNLRHKVRNPAQLALMFTFEPDSWYCKRFNISSIKAFKQHIAPIRQALKLELTQAAKSFRQSILSSEHLGFMLDSEDKIKLLRDTLTPAYDRARIVHYFRDPISLCRAEYSEALRAEYTGSYQRFCLETIQKKRPTIRYGMLAEQWAAVFGISNCHFASGIRNTLKNNHITHDFAQYLLAESPFSETQFRDQSTTNPSLKRIGCTAFRLINIELPYWIISEGKTCVNTLNTELKKNVERLLARGDEIISCPVEDEVFKTAYHDILHLRRYARPVADRCLETADSLLRYQAASNPSQPDEVAMAAGLISEAAEIIARERQSNESLKPATKLALEKVAALMRRHKQS